jgi:hypothetical protein
LTFDPAAKATAPRKNRFDHFVAFTHARKARRHPIACAFLDWTRGAANVRGTGSPESGEESSWFAEQPLSIR